MNVDCRLPLRSHDRQKFTPLNFNAHAAQRVHTGFAKFVILVRLFDADDHTGCCNGFPGFDLAGRLHES